MSTIASRPHPSNDCYGFKPIGPDEWHWSHAPTRRSVRVERRDGKWFVVVQKHDEHGNPAHQMHTLFMCGGNCSDCKTQWSEIECETHEEAFRRALGILKSIEDEACVVPFPTQVEMFGGEK